MEIKCEFEKRQWADSPKLYTCKVTSALITSSDTEIKSFIGIHHKIKRNEDVKALWIKEAVVEYFPRGLHKIFPNLTAISILNCGLKTICRKDLIGLENIEHLFLGGNILKSLPSNIFMNMPKLRRISFFNNKLEFLSSQFLKPIIDNGLVWLDFESNTNIDVSFGQGHPKSLRSLEQLMHIIDSKCGKPLGEEFNFTKKMMTGCEELWLTGKFSDFIIKCGTREFRVHKWILVNHSPVFAAMFDKDEDSSEMTVEDLSAEAVENFLIYLYTGEVSFRMNSLEVFALATKLEVSEMKLIAQDIIIDDLDELNAYKIFAFAHKYEAEDLKRFAFNEIKKMFPGTILSSEMKLDEVRELIEGKKKFENMLQKFNRNDE